MATLRRKSSIRSRPGTSDAQALVDSALSMASSIANHQKGQLASTIYRAAEATQEYGQSLDGLPYMRGYIMEAANALDNIGSYVEQADAGNLWHDVGTFARRRPMATFGVAVLTGLIAGQFLQSMSESRNARGYSNGRTRTRSASRHG